VKRIVCLVRLGQKFIGPRKSILPTVDAAVAEEPPYVIAMWEVDVRNRYPESR